MVNCPVKECDASLGAGCNRIKTDEHLALAGLTHLVCRDCGDHFCYLCGDIVHELCAACKEKRLSK